MRFRHKFKVVSGFLIAILSLSITTPVLADASNNSPRATDLEKVSRLQQNNKELTQETTFLPNLESNINSQTFLDNKTVASLARDSMSGIGGSGRANWGGLGAAGGAAIVYIGGRAYKNGVQIHRAERKILNKVLKDNNHVDLGKFHGSGNYKTGPKGYHLEKDRAAGKPTAHNGGANGSYWKLYDRNSKVASVNKNGKILKHYKK